MVIPTATFANSCSVSDEQGGLGSARILGLLRVVVLDALVAGYGSQNENLSLCLDEAAKQAPRANPANIVGVGFARGPNHISEEIGVESGHCAEVLREQFTEPALERRTVCRRRVGLPR
jgi:hypothetical protein